MKRFVLKVLLFFSLVTVIDIICSWSFDFLRSKARGGQTFKNEYLFNSCKDDILILGSSRANHHYIPSIITDSLGITCYNAGVEGCGIIPAYIYYRMVCDRNKPKLVIYEVTPNYDYLIDQGGYSNYLGSVRQYADRDVVKYVNRDFSDELESLRLLSGMYRNNSCFIKNIKDVVLPKSNYRGYDPLYGQLMSNVISKHEEAENDNNRIVVDSLKLYYVEKLIAEIIKDGVGLVCIVSPRFTFLSPDIDSQYVPIKEMCKKYGVPFIDNTNIEGITGTMDYFQDLGHLNDKGAQYYTASLIPLLRQSIQ